VNGWAPLGGSELGTSRQIPEGPDFFDIARTLEAQKIDALMIVGGFAGYQSAHALTRERLHFRAFRIPILCIPASIDNNLPGAEYSVGADSALNSITEVVDKIKQSAVASNRVFVVEVMGRYCDYLALTSALATGAERVYLHEEGVDLHDLAHDIAELKHGFRHGKRLGLVIRNEQANARYTTDVLAALLEEEGEELYDVRTSILGHLQQGGNPSPFDRILAVRLAARALDFVEDAKRQRDEEPPVVCLGWTSGAFHIANLEAVWPTVDEAHQRPKRQWWMDLRPIARMLAKPGPESPMPPT
jgi:6-phosphofructokinase 1